ncbi:hypothetical protein MRX96_042264 [Rhipicephalus microplus]
MVQIDRICRCEITPLLTTRNSGGVQSEPVQRQRRAPAKLAERTHYRSRPLRCAVTDTFYRRHQHALSQLLWRQRRALLHPIDYGTHTERQPIHAGEATVCALRIR